MIGGTSAGSLAAALVLLMRNREGSRSTDSQFGLRNRGEATVLISSKP